MDAFEVRMQFLTLLSKLSSSLASIQKVTAYALQNSIKCGEDIWDCMKEECLIINLNQRINLLYLIDSLLMKSISLNSNVFTQLISRDLSYLVELIVPNTKYGILNRLSTIQVIKDWKIKRLLPITTLDPILDSLQSSSTTDLTESTDESSTTFSKVDILRRIEDDRERHKRLRERIWVLPVPASLQTISIHPLPPLSIKNSPFSPASPAELNPSINSRPINPLKLRKSITTLPNPSTNTTGLMRVPGPELAIEIEFDQLWENAELEEKRIKSLTRLEKKRKLEVESTNDDVEMEGDSEKRLKLEEEEGNKKWLLTQEEKDSLKRERDRCFIPLNNTVTV